MNDIPDHYPVNYILFSEDLLQVVLSVGASLSVEDELVSIIRPIIATIASKPVSIHLF